LSEQTVPIRDVSSLANELFESGHLPLRLREDMKHPHTYPTCLRN